MLRVWLTSKCDKLLKMGLICHENELKLSLNPSWEFFSIDFDSQEIICVFEKKMCEIGEIVFGGNYREPWGPRDILVNLWPNISSKSDILGLPYCMKIGRCRLLHILQCQQIVIFSDQWKIIRVKAKISNSILVILAFYGTFLGWFLGPIFLSRLRKKDGIIC